MGGDSEVVRMAELWDRVARSYDTAIPYFSVLGQRLVDLVDPQPGDRVLDVATGRGACLFPTAARVGEAGHVVGFDVSTEMVAETSRDPERRAASNTSLLVADAQRLGVAAGSFDAVTCSQAMGQFPEAAAAAEEFRRVLRPGGRIGVQRDIGSDPRWAFTSEILAAVVDRPPAPSVPERRVDVVATLEEAGFVDIERSEDPLELVFPDEQVWWDWAWTTGSGRRDLDPLPDETRRDYLDAVAERMQSLRTEHGFPMVLTIESVLARR